MLMRDKVAALAYAERTARQGPSPIRRTGGRSSRRGPTTRRQTAPLPCTVTGVDVNGVSLILLTFGIGGFVGPSASGGISDRWTSRIGRGRDPPLPTAASPPEGPLRPGGAGRGPRPH